jgi:hypothetical protein
MNQTVPMTQRATMNGLSNLGSSTAQGLGPIFAGLLVSESVYLLGSLGSLLMYGAIGFLGLGVTILACVLLRDDSPSYDVCADESMETAPLVELTEAYSKVRKEHS